MAGCHLVVAEGDGEPPIVAIDDLNAVVSRAAEVIIRIIHNNHNRSDMLLYIYLVVVVLVVVVVVVMVVIYLMFITLGLQAMTCLN